MNKEKAAKDSFLAKTSKQVAKTTQKLEEVKQLLPKDVGEGIQRGLFKIPKKSESQFDASKNNVAEDVSNDRVKFKNDSDVECQGVSCRYLSQLKDKVEDINMSASSVKTSFTTNVTKFASNVKDELPTRPPRRKDKQKDDTSSNDSDTLRVKDPSTEPGCGIKNRISKLSTKFTDNTDTSTDESNSGNIPKKGSQLTSPSKNNENHSTARNDFSDTLRGKQLNTEEEASGIKNRINKLNVSIPENKDASSDGTNSGNMPIKGNKFTSHMKHQENQKTETNNSTCSLRGKDSNTEAGSSIKNRIGKFSGDFTDTKDAPSDTSNSTTVISKSRPLSAIIKKEAEDKPSTNSSPLRVKRLNPDSVSNVRNRISAQLDLVFADKKHAPSVGSHSTNVASQGVPIVPFKENKPKKSISSEESDSPTTMPNQRYSSTATDRFSNSSNVSDSSFNERQKRFDRNSSSSESPVKMRHPCFDNTFASARIENEKDRNTTAFEGPTGADLDSVLVESEKLSHITSNRAKSCPPNQQRKRRPPSRFIKK